MSEPGKQNGLYWETKEDEPASPAGPFLAKAGGEGYGGTPGSAASEPYHGYFYRTLKAQGAAAKGGAKLSQRWQAHAGSRAGRVSRTI